MGTAVAWRRLDAGATTVTAAATTAGVCRVMYPHEGALEWAKWRARHLPDAVEVEENPWLDRLEAELARYFAGERGGFTVPVDLRGTPFQVRVWEALREVPAGTVMTYGELARIVSGSLATRAVGRAVGANPVPVVVPCHRVVGRGGDLTGYGGGLELKRMLLDLEGVRVPRAPGEAPGQQRLPLG